MQSIMQHQFSQIPSINIPRSVFNRSHGHKTTFDEGWLIPIYLDEALPGDTFNLRATIMARLATPILPIMDNLFIDTFYFAVPNRLLWENWVKMCGEQKSPEDEVDYITPDMNTLTVSEGSLGDYFGLPINIIMADTGSVSALPFRAYNLIYNEWFRDENLCVRAYEKKDNGPDDGTLYTLLKRCKRHDYFTSALLWPQKGPGVMLPLGTTAPVISDGNAFIFNDGTNNLNLRMHSSASSLQTVIGGQKSIGDDLASNIIDNIFDKAIGMAAGDGTGLITDLTNAASITINSLRQAFQLQRLYERDARGGTRYTEILRSHFGVVSPDARLQRPEYLGGSSQRININAVQQTSATDTVSPQGNLAAYGLVVDNKGGFHHSFTEHCIVMGLACVRADLTYQQGINRMWSRKTRFDYYWPVLANLGEQAILYKEIFYAHSEDFDDTAFGYQERFAEYRYYPSKITGKMRHNSTGPLDIWHLSQYFDERPTLEQTFIEENPPIERVVAVKNQPHFIFDSYFDLKCARPMPVYSVPGLIDHF